MREKLISVIVPVYNDEKYINECIESIMHQTYANLEIVIVNDGSTDNTQLLCEEYAKKDRRINIVNKKNGGLVSAWKTGIDNTSDLSEFVVFIDSDDYISDEYINTMVKMQDETKVDMVVCSMTIKYTRHEIDVSNNIVEGYYDRTMLESKVFPELLYGGNFEKRAIHMSRSGKLINKKLIRNNSDYVEKCVTFGEDKNLIIPLTLECQSMLVINEKRCRYYYRYHEDSMLHGYDKNMLNSVLSVHDSLMRMCDERKLDEFRTQVVADFLADSIQTYKNELLNPKGLRQAIYNIEQLIHESLFIEAVNEVEWSHYSNLNVAIIHILSNYNFFNRYIMTAVLRCLKRVRIKKLSSK